MRYVATPVHEQHPAQVGDAHDRPPVAVQAPASLRGHVDAIAVGRGFVHIQGWACNADGSAATMPLTIGAGGRSFPGFNLRFRADLDEAGIAGGQAAIDVVIAADGLALGTGHAVTFTDATGLSCTVWCPAENVCPFIPLGHIEEVHARFVQGWVFDPGATDPRHAPRLLLNEDEVIEVVPGAERFDLNFDLGDGGRTYGFEIPAGPVTDAIRKRPYIGSGEANLDLVSSGTVMASVRVRLADGALVAADRLPRRMVPYRLPTSALLDELLAKRTLSNTSLRQSR